jgi:hypothetical protein
MQYSAAVNNARLDAIESTIGTAARLHLYSGAIPATPATAASGTLLADIALPTDWMSAAVSPNKSKLGTWTGTGLPAAGAGTNIGYFRILNSAGSAVGIQGTVTATGGGGDMTFNNINLANGQSITVDTFTISTTMV